MENEQEKDLSENKISYKALTLIYNELIELMNKLDLE